MKKEYAENKSIVLFNNNLNINCIGSLCSISANFCCIDNYWSIINSSTFTMPPIFRFIIVMEEVCVLLC